MARYLSRAFVPAARSSVGPLGRAAVFLDRDGTLNEEVGHIAHSCALRLLPDAATGVRLLNRAGFAMVVTTNQSGIGRGLLTEAMLATVQETLLALLAADGAHLDALYYCPHHPDAGCLCRKPRPDMLHAAAADLGISLQHSYVIGDTMSDLEFGWSAGCHTVLVRTGKGQETAQDLDGSVRWPDAVCATLTEAAEWVVAHRDTQAPASVIGLPPRAEPPP